jgi:hypothetical protein
MNTEGSDKMKDFNEYLNEQLQDQEFRKHWLDKHIQDFMEANKQYQSYDLNDWYLRFHGVLNDDVTYTHRLDMEISLHGKDFLEKSISWENEDGPGRTDQPVYVDEIELFQLFRQVHYLDNEKYESFIEN